VRICLVFEHSLSHYSRLLTEIRGLQEAGAEVSLLTSYSIHEEPPPGVTVHRAPLVSTTGTERIPASELRWRPARIADNTLRKPLRYLLNTLFTRKIREGRRAALRSLSETTNVFWVIDFPGLASTLEVARPRQVPVVYETVDLVPEYPYRGERYRRRALAAERSLISQVAGFITACESYADYYMGRYGRVIKRPPVVRDNMPEHVAPTARSAGTPLRLLFLGSLMFDRPISEILHAMSLVSAPVTLSIQGKNLLGEAPARLLAELGIDDRVRLLDPCPPESIVETASEYDVGIVALRGENENERRASTSKLFTYMAAGLAVLASDLPGIASVVEKHENGVLVVGMDPKTWAQAISELATTSTREIDAMKERSLAAAGDYSWNLQRAAFIGEFTRALDTTD
jgi:glycosyltransferase involved in cell wall biosynthesis